MNTILSGPRYRSRGFLFLKASAVAVVCLLHCSDAGAAIIATNSLAEFITATGNRSRNVVDFEAGTLGQPVAPSFGGLTFGNVLNFTPSLTIENGDSFFSGQQMSTKSGNQFMGSNAVSFITLKSTSSFTISKPNTSAFGFFIVSPSILGSGEIGIRFGSATVTNNTVREDLSASGKENSFAYFIGLVEQDASASLGPITVFANSETPFGIDDITTITAVPEPSSIALILVGATFGYSRLRKSRKLHREKIDNNAPKC